MNVRRWDLFCIFVASRFSFLTGDYCDGDNHAEYRRMSVDGVLFVFLSPALPS